MAMPVVYEALMTGGSRTRSSISRRQAGAWSIIRGFRA